MRRRVEMIGEEDKTAEERKKVVDFDEMERRLSGMKMMFQPRNNPWQSSWKTSIT